MRPICGVDVTRKLSIATPLTSPILIRWVSYYTTHDGTGSDLANNKVKGIAYVNVIESALRSTIWKSKPSGGARRRAGRPQGGGGGRDRLGGLLLRPLAERIERATALDGPGRALSRMHVVRALPSGTRGGRPAARRPLRPARPPGPRPAAARLLDVGRAARPASRGARRAAGSRSQRSAAAGHAPGLGRAAGGRAARRGAIGGHWAGRLLGAPHATSSGSGWCTRSPRAARPPSCSPASLLARRGRHGAGPARRWRRAGLDRRRRRAPTSAATWRCASAPGPSHAESVEPPERRWAGTTSARWPTCRPGRPRPASARLPQPARAARRARSRPRALRPLRPPGRARPHQGRLVDRPCGTRPACSCPWHGSAFRLSDGSRRAAGPPPRSQPAFRGPDQRGGPVQVRPLQASVARSRRAARLPRLFRSAAG